MVSGVPNAEAKREGVQPYLALAFGSEPAASRSAMSSGVFAIAP